MPDYRNIGYILLYGQIEIIWEVEVSLIVQDEGKTCWLCQDHHFRALVGKFIIRIGMKHIQKHGIYRGIRNKGGIRRWGIEG